MPFHNLNRTGIIYILMLCLNLHVLFAQKPTYVFSGIVSSPEGEPIPGAAVYFHETGKGVYTDSTGSFEIRNIPAGSYHLHITAIGYIFRAQTLTFMKDLRDLHLIMIPSELRLNEILIEAESDKTEIRESSQTFEVINRRFIERYSSGNLMNTLERLPGISAIRTGVGISKPVIRGMSFNRVVVVDNGIRQEGQQWGADHGLELDEMNADRIEILRGPASVMYGSDAIAGVIKIKQAPMPQHQSWQASVQGNYRSVNQLLGGSAMVAANHNGNYWRFRMSMQDFGDYQVPAKEFKYNRYILPIYDSRLKNTAGKERSFAGTAGIQRKWGNTDISVSKYAQTSGFFPGAFGIPRANSLLPDGDIRNTGLPRQVTEHFKLSSHTNVLFRKNWLETDAGYQRNFRREEAAPHSLNPTLPANDILALSLLLETFSLHAKYHWNFSPKFSAISGLSGQYQQNIKGGYEHLLPEYKSFQGGAFIFTQYRLHPDWILNAGIRYDGGTVRIEKFESLVYNKAGLVTDTLLRNRSSHRIFANVSGSGGISWQLNEYLSMKANLSSDFRFPTVAELASNGVHHGTFRHVMGDISLSPERGFQGDWNMSWEKRKFKFSLTPFYSYFFNYIYLSPSGQFSVLPEGGQVFTYQEAPTRFWGGEVSGEIKIFRDFSLSGSWEYVNNLNLTTRIPLAFTPPGCLTGEAEWIRNRPGKFISQIFLSLTCQQYSTQNRTDRNEPATPGYTLIHVSQGFHFQKGKQEFRLMFQVQNAGNSTHLNHMSRYRLIQVPEPGRNWIVTLSIPLRGKLPGNKNRNEP